MRLNELLDSLDSIALNGTRSTSATGAKLYTINMPPVQCVFDFSTKGMFLEYSGDAATLHALFTNALGPKPLLNGSAPLVRAMRSELPESGYAFVRKELPYANFKEAHEIISGTLFRRA